MAAKDGDSVRIHYTGKLEDGSVFDSSDGREPLEFELGGGQVIPGFENAVRGMAAGDKKSVTIPAEEAYGAHNQDLVVSATRDQFPEGAVLEVGAEFQLEQDEGRVIPVRVTDVEGDDVTLDANHPLAGKALLFDLELVEIA